MNSCEWRRQAVPNHYQTSTGQPGPRYAGPQRPMPNLQAYRSQSPQHRPQQPNYVPRQPNSGPYHQQNPTTYHSTHPAASQQANSGPRGQISPGSRLPPPHQTHPRPPQHAPNPNIPPHPTYHQQQPFDRSEPERASQRLYQKRENYMRRTESMRRQRKMVLQDGDSYLPEQGGRRPPVGLFDLSAGMSYACSISAWMKILQILVGIIVCGCAGILCIRNEGCTVDVRTIGANTQIFVVAGAAFAILTSAIFYFLHLCSCSYTDSFRGWEIPSLSILLVLYLAVAVVETWYAASSWLPYADQWATAAGFAWFGTGLYAGELSYWSCFYTPKPIRNTTAYEQRIL